MFDIYEKTLKVLKEESFSSELNEEILSYISWRILTKKKKGSSGVQEYYKEHLPGEGDALTKILADPDKQESRLRLLLLPEEFWTKIEETTLSTKPDLEKEKALAEQLKSPLALQRLIKTSLDPKLSLIQHFSYEAPKDVRMFYFGGDEVFLALGIDHAKEQKQSFTQEERLAIFKALADESRLTIFNALLKERLSSTELSEKAEVSLSTVNHHMKTLIQVGLVVLDLDSKDRRGSGFIANKEVYGEILQELLNEIL